MGKSAYESYYCRVAEIVIMLFFSMLFFVTNTVLTDQLKERDTNKFNSTAINLKRFNPLSFQEAFPKPRSLPTGLVDQLGVVHLVIVYLAVSIT